MHPCEMAWVVLEMSMAFPSAKASDSPGNTGASWAPDPSGQAKLETPQWPYTETHTQSPWCNNNCIKVQFCLFEASIRSKQHQKTASFHTTTCQFPPKPLDPRPRRPHPKAPPVQLKGPKSLGKMTKRYESCCLSASPIHLVCLRIHKHPLWLEGSFSLLLKCIEIWRNQGHDKILDMLNTRCFLPQGSKLHIRPVRCPALWKRKKNPPPEGLENLEPWVRVNCQQHLGSWDLLHMGVSLHGGTSNLHPKMIIFSRKTNGCWVPLF